jgi:hypothetical protein
MSYVKSYYSALNTLKLAYIIGLNSWSKPTFLLSRYRVLLLRHCLSYVKFAMLRKSSTLSDIAHLVIEYVSISLAPLISFKKPSYIVVSDYIIESLTGFNNNLNIY